MSTKLSISPGFMWLWESKHHKGMQFSSRKMFLMPSRHQGEKLEWIWENSWTQPCFIPPSINSIVKNTTLQIKGQLGSCFFTLFFVLFLRLESFKKLLSFKINICPWEMYICLYIHWCVSVLCLFHKIIHGKEVFLTHLDCKSWKDT